MLIFSSVPELEKAVTLSGLSSRTFQRNLQKMGVSYSQLVLETRIGIARQWIDHGDIAIGEISKALGYKNSSNFSRAFLGLVGQSPRDYRNRKD
jgi:AraC-like DNA-binding protein